MTLSEYLSEIAFAKISGEYSRAESLEKEMKSNYPFPNASISINDIPLWATNKLKAQNNFISPFEIEGKWKQGYALNLHTISAKPLEKDEDGNVTKWDTKYSELGNELHKFKYRNEKFRIDKISKAAAEFLKEKNKEWQINLIIPIPPSDNTSHFQPVYELAKSIGNICNLTVDFTTLKKLKSTHQLKDIENPDIRRKTLEDAFDIAPNSLSNKIVLLFDDLYRSGETLNAVCDIVKNKGNARDVYALTITKTRSKK